MTVKEVLIAAKASIDKPQKWCKHDYQIGNRMCAVGAVRSAQYGDPQRAPGSRSAAHRALKKLAEAVHGRSVWQFNDSSKTRHADVMAAFDRAIASSEEPS